MTGEAAKGLGDAVRRAVLPLVLGACVAAVPTPGGLTPSAWYFFSLFVVVVAALITEPIPAFA